MIKKLRQWKWDKMPVYNGFTHDERVRGWQLTSWFMDNGWVAKATVCAISGSTERIQMHSENYYELTTYPISQSLHFALHQRFKRPEAWMRIVERYSISGDEWFAKLAMTPIDLAGDLRRAHGDPIADIFAHVPLPLGVSVPIDQIHFASSPDNAALSEVCPPTKRY